MESHCPQWLARCSSVGLGAEETRVVNDVAAGMVAVNFHLENVEKVGDRNKTPTGEPNH